MLEMSLIEALPALTLFIICTNIVAQQYAFVF